VCDLYSVTKGQQAIREIAGAMRDRTGNLPLFPAVFPDYAAPIVRNQPDGRELAMARWGMPSPAFALKGRNSDAGVMSGRRLPVKAALTFRDGSWVRSCLRPFGAESSLRRP
jgi:putative SOS response-associated peptidase YedK